MKTKVREIRTKSQKSHEKLLKQWRKDDERYVEPHFFQNLMQSIGESKIIVLTGGPGCGKTATSRHVAIKLLQSHFTIVSIKYPKEITFGDPELKQVFVLDDAFGNICLKEQLHTEFERYFEDICNMLDSKSKLILTSRKTVFMEAKRLIFLNSFTYKVFDFGDDENELTKQDMLSILSAYEIDINPLEQELQKVVGESDVFHMFPLLCKLFSTNLEYKRKGCSFFKEPYPIIMKHLEEMEKERRLSYAALVLCMLNEGLISENVLDTELVPKETIYRCCKIQSSTDNWEIMEAVSQMVGTYLTECDGEFYFVHDLLFEIVACHFGRNFPKEIINLMTSEFISQRLTLEDKKEEDFLTIKISESEYNKLAERLYRDLKNLKLYSVFDSEFLHNEKICDHFLSLLSRDTDVDIKDFFLSLNTDFKDYTTMRMPNKKTLDSTEELHFNMKMLIEDAEKVFWFYEDEEYGAYSNNCQIRLISWIIAFGHNKILKYIVDQMISRNEELETVFGKDLMSQTRCLVLACYSKNPDIVKLVLKHTDPACRNMNTHQEEESVCIPMHKLITPLTLSILLESSDILDIILDAEVNVNAFGVTCLSPLLIAIYRSDLNTVQKLVAAGANVNQCSCDEFPLIVGSMQNNTEIVEFLVKNGAQCNFRMREDYTALYFASKYGNMKMLKTLFQFGADYSIYKERDKSPFCIAAREGHLSVLELLLEHGANCNYVDKFGWTPLRLASANGFSNIVLYLLEKGADVIHAFPLFMAIEKRHLEISKILIERGTDIDMLIKTSGCFDPELLTCLHKAVKVNNTQIVELLIQRKTTAYTVKDSDGMTPLEVSLWTGHKDITQLLIKGENCYKQGNGNSHFFNLIVNIRASILFLNDKDEIKIKGEKAPLFLSSSSLINEVLSEDRYGSMKDLLSLGLQEDRRVIKVGQKLLKWTPYFEFDEYPYYNSLTHYIVKCGIDVHSVMSNVKLSKLIIDHVFWKKSPSEYNMKPFLGKGNEPTRWDPMFSMIRNKQIKDLGSYEIGYIMDNSDSILHLLLRFITNLKWKLFLDDEPESELCNDFEYIRVSDVLSHLKVRMRRHSF